MHRILFAVTFIHLFWACTPEIDTPPSSRGNLPVQGLLVIGDSYAAGMHSGSWSEQAFSNSPAIGLSDAFQHIGLVNFNSPGFAQNFNYGFENGQYTGPYLLENWVDCLGDSITFPRREKYTQRPAEWDEVELALTYDNYAVPGLRPEDLNQPLTYGGLFDRPFLQRLTSDTILHLNSVAKLLSPEFIFLWLGTEMVFDHLIKSETDLLPSPGSFAHEIELFLDSIPDLQGGVIASIPDIFEFPFFNLVLWNSLEINQSQANLLNNLYDWEDYTYAPGANPFNLEADNSDGYRRADSTDLIFYNLPLENVKCAFYGSINPIEEQYFIDAQTQQLVKNLIAQYNQELARIAAERDFAFVDMQSYFATIQAGYREKGIDFSFDFITGQLFSLDARHLTPRGYGLVINEILRVIEQKYNANLPGINVAGRAAVNFP